MVQQSSSDDSSSDSDDEMRSRLMETVVTVEQIKKDEKKKGFGFSQSNNLPNVDIDKIFHNLGGKPSEEKNSNLIKVGPYGDIELSQGQINRLITILRSDKILGNPILTNTKIFQGIHGKYTGIQVRFIYSICCKPLAIRTVVIRRATYHVITSSVYISFEVLITISFKKLHLMSNQSD